MQADEKLDCLGLYCPMPIIKTAEKIKTLAKGQVLEILADDPGFFEDIFDWCEMTGHVVLHREVNDGEIKAWVKKFSS